MKPKLILRDVQFNKGLWFISILGIALGVAGWIGMKSSADRAVSSFEESVRRTVGRATHVITARSGGIDQTTYHHLQQRLPSPVSPVRVDHARIGSRPGEHSGTLMKVVGMDPMTFFNFYNLPGQLQQEDFPVESFLLGKNVAVAPGRLSADGILHLRVGDRTEELNVVSTLRTESNTRTAYVDLGLSEALFGRSGELSKILVRDPNWTPDQDALPENLVVRKAGTSSPSVQSLLEAYALNLQALALLSLFVGAFLVYNTMILYSHRQNQVLSLLRTLGLTSTEVLGFTLMSVLVLGLVGTLLGLVLGLGLSLLISPYVVESIGSIVPGILAAGGPDLLWSLGLGVLSGILISLLGGLDPILRNWGISPREWRRQSRLSRTNPSFEGTNLLLLGGIGVVLLALTAGGVLLSERSILAGHAACFTLSLAGSALSVLALAGVSKLTLPGQWITMAARGLGRHSVRSSVIVGSLVAAFSMVFAVTVLVDSFRASVISWSQGNIKAAHYVSSVPEETTEADPVLDETYRRELRRKVGPRAVSTLRKKTVHTDRGHSLHLRGLNASIVREHQPLTLNDSLSKPYRRFSAGAVFLSEPGAYRLNKDVGDTLALPLPEGSERTVKIAGVFNDYTPKYGIVYLPNSSMTDWYPDAKVRDLAVYASNPSVNEAVRSLTRNYGYVHRTRQELRKRVLNLFDRNFAVTRVMKFLAIAIAAIGLTLTLMALNQTRGEFFGRLLASGAGKNHLIRLMSFEGLLLGGVSFLAALPTGYALSHLLVNVINRRSFGWSIELRVDSSIVYELGVIVLVSVGIALLLPAVRLMKKSIPELTRETGHQ